jgi:fatty acid desaturase
VTSADLMAKNKVAWYRTPVSRADMAALLERSDLKGLAQAGGHLALVAATGALAWYASVALPWYVFLALLYLHGTVFSFLAAGFHELCHQTVFKTKALNPPFLHLVSWLVWSNPVWYWTSHQEHHKYTLHPPDDLEVELPYKLTWSSFLRSAIVNPWDFVYRLRRFIRTALGRVETRWDQHLFPPEAAALRRRLQTWARLALLAHALLAAAALALGWWQFVVLVTLAPFYGQGLIYLVANPQHAGLQDNVPDFRLCTRTYTVNPVIQFLYWHMNYHLDHHMYAAVPCYNLGKLHRLIRRDLPPCPHGLVATWREILTIVARQKADPTYQYAAPLPAPRPLAPEAG